MYEPESPRWPLPRTVQVLHSRPRVLLDGEPALAALDEVRLARLRPIDAAQDPGDANARAVRVATDEHWGRARARGA